MSYPRCYFVERGIFLSSSLWQPNKEQHNKKSEKQHKLIENVLYDIHVISFSVNSSTKYYSIDREGFLINVANVVYFLYLNIIPLWSTLLRLRYSVKNVFTNYLYYYKNRGCMSVCVCVMFMQATFPLMDQLHILHNHRSWPWGWPMAI